MTKLFLESRQLVINVPNTGTLTNELLARKRPPTLAAFKPISIYLKMCPVWTLSPLKEADNGKGFVHG